MTLAIRPLIAVLLISFASGSFAAPKKPAVLPPPAAPAACADFYNHVNHPWLLTHPLLDGAQSYSRWDEQNSLAEQRTRDLLARSGATNPGVASNLLAALVASAHDQINLDPAAHLVAQPLLAQIDAMRKPRDIPKVIAALHAAGVSAVFGFDALRDAQSGQARLWFYPGGFGLPDPAYYIATDPELQRGVGLYRNYLGELLGFAGVSEDKLAEQANWAFVMEQSLALSMGPATSETFIIDPAQKNSYPARVMTDFTKAQGLSPTQISVQQLAFFRALDTMLEKPSVPQWKAYLRTQVVHALAPALANDLRRPYLAALNMVPAGAVATPASERLAELTRREVAELLSAAYAESYLSSADQQRAEAIAEAVRAAMGRALERAAWLSPEGKAAARTKLAAMRLAIGKPTDPTSFAGLTLDRTSHAGNVLALRRWNRARSLARLGGAPWPSSPVSQAQPAIGYQAGENQLIVSSAALSPPAFDGLSAASSYGSLGALLAQQMSLAFSDFTGNDGFALASRQAGLIAQYSAYPVAGMAMVNGVRMQPQNAADLAAMEIAWDAFNAQGAADLIAQQEFFRAWAAVWARQDTPSALVAAQSVSVFAPAKWRVNGPLVNTPAFAQAFACKPGQAMVSGNPVSIWR